MELNNKVLSLRIEKGCTQEQLAEMLGVSAAAVSKWERGNAYPDITLLPKLAEVFGVSVDYLLGYDVKIRKSVTRIISEANELRKEMKGDEAEQLLKQTLARYPNDSELTFELARNRYLCANYKRKAERDRLLDEAAEGFRCVSENDKNKARRDRSLCYLSTISLINKDYDKAEEYNDKLLCAKGLYPRATAAVIKLQKSRDESGLRALKEAVYDSVVESTVVMPWITAYYMGEGDFDGVIRENLHAVKVYEEFSDCKKICDELAECNEALALAYANKGEFDLCLGCLEKACDFALKHDNADNEGCGLQDCVAEKEKHSSSRVMLMALNSSERDIYAPVRETERYKEIIRRLDAELSE